MSSFFTKFIADILQAKKPIGYPIDFIMETATKRPRMLLEYTDAERQKMGIPSGAESRGGKWYQGDTYVGKVVNGKFVSAAEEPEDAHAEPTIAKQGDQWMYKVAGKLNKPLYARGRYLYTRPEGGNAYMIGTTSGNKFVPTTKPYIWPGEEPVEASDEDATPETFKSIQSKQNSAVSPLHDALVDGEPSTIALVVGDLQLYRDEDGCLASGLEGVGYLYGKGELAQKAARQLEVLLAPLGITIPSQRELVASDAQADAFKPQNLAKGVRRASIKLTRGERGIFSQVAVGDKEYRVIPTTGALRQKLIERYVPMVEAYTQMGMSGGKAASEAELVIRAVASHNKKLQIIAAEAEKKKDAFLEVTDRKELANALVDLVVNASGTNLTDEQQTAVRDIFARLAGADTPEEFDAVWADPRTRQTRSGVNYGNTDYLLPMLGAANLPTSAFPVLCETIEVMRKSCGNTQVLIPTRQTFELVDLIVLNSPIDLSPEVIEAVDTLPEDVARQLQFVNVQVEFVGVKSGGKKGTGRASASHTRVQLTEFDDPQIRPDLISLIGHDAHAKLWACVNKDEYNVVSAERLSTLRPHLDSIISYYALESQTENMSDEEKMTFVFATLGMGTLPEYDADGNFVSAGKQASLFTADNVTELNRLQLRLYSFIGFASDAIYNRHAQLQGFKNVTYGTSGIRETDGMSRMTRSVFQFNRQAGLWKNSEGAMVVRPSYSFTASLEYADSTEDLQYFARRNRPKDTNELLLEAKQSQASIEAKKLGLVYVGYNKWGPEKGKPATHITDPDTKKLVQITAPTAEPKAPVTQPASAAQAGYIEKNVPTRVASGKRRTSRDSSAAARHERTATDPDPKIEAMKIAGIEIRASDVMDGIFTGTAEVEIGPQKIRTAIREMIDPNTGLKIDTTKPEGRARAVDVLTERLNSFSGKGGKIEKICNALLDKRMGRGQQTLLRKWLGNLGEIAGMRDILAAGHQAYLYADSNPKNDIVALVECKDEVENRNLKMVAVSTKSTSGKAVGRLEASAVSYLTDSLGDKIVTYAGETGEVSANAGDVALALFGMQKRIYSSATRGDISTGKRFGGTERRITVLPDRRHLYDETGLAGAEKQNREVQTDNESGGQRALVSARKITTDDIKIFSDPNNASYKLLLRDVSKVMGGNAEKAKFIIELLKTRLEDRIKNSKDFRLTDFDEWMTAEIVELLDIPDQATGQKSEIQFESDMMIASFSAEGGYTGCRMISGKDMGDQIREKYPDLAEMDTREKLKRILGWKTDTRGVGLTTKAGGYVDPLQRAVAPVNQLKPDAFKTMEQYLESVCEEG